MPFLVRIIAQRLIVIGLSTMAFFGVNPDIELPTDEEILIREEEQQEIVQNIVNIPEPSSEDTPLIPLPKINILDLNNIRENINTPVVTQTKTQSPGVQPTTIKVTSTITPVSAPVPGNNNAGDPRQIGDDGSVREDDSDLIRDDENNENREENILRNNNENLEKETLNVSETSSIANATVNIVCVRHNGNKIHLTTGSGVIISPKGIVLTNTHVAQYFLLEDIGYECSLRRENIPLYGFEAEPIFLSEKWIENNFLLISSPSPTGTGEDDYALLKITKNTNPALSLPRNFAYIDPDTRSETVEIGDQVTVAGYPGGKTGVFDIDSQTSLKTERTSVANVFTFEQTSVDVFSTRDTEVARRGSSGGGVFKDGELVGIISTINTGSSATKQVINALTLDYINRDLKKETGNSLSNYLSGDLTDLMQSFQSSVVPRLKELLLRNL
ncbi:serine protease [Candidatus Pacebacteria bacterium]|nr:serine protease [Candidatus Paceibacterota bacterium]